MVELTDFRMHDSVGEEIAYSFDTEGEREDALLVLKQSNGWSRQAVTASNLVIGVRDYSVEVPDEIGEDEPEGRLRRAARAMDPRRWGSDG